MPRTISGNPVGVGTPLLGIVAKEHVPIHRRGTHIYMGPASNAKSGYAGYITTDEKDLPIVMGRRRPRIVLVNPADLSALNHGDVLLVREDGSLIVVWARGEKSNALFMTAACNLRCIMCPQPPEKHSKHQTEINKTILGLLGKDVTDICLTGGEPTLFMDEFLEILAICNQRFPTVPLTILSNGIQLGDLETAKAIARVRNKLITFCVPLYSDIDDIHDMITGTKNSFYQTIRGIQNLALLKVPTEIRYVITQMNFGRLSNFSDFVYRNFPFVVHVAYMGCEMTGLAKQNANKVWVDPAEYSVGLSDAVRSLEKKGTHVSVYNHQLCILSGSAKRNARQSISEWKNSFLPICTGCQVKQACGGFFETSGGYVSRSISPIYAIETPGSITV